MKNIDKSIVVSTPDAEFSALAYKEDFRESISKVAEMDFDVVELAVRDPEAVETEQIFEVLSDFELEVPAIGTGQAYGEEGLSFTHPDREIRARAVERIKDQMDFAEELEGAQIIIGLLRGKLSEDQSHEEAEGYFLECLQECADYNEEIILTLEPINRYETDLYNTISEMIEIIEKADRKNIGLLADTFHMNIEEPVIAGGFRKSAKHLSHVHFADSNRHAPGSGHLNFNRIISVLNEIEYNGAVSAEILPEPTPDESARLTVEHYKKLGL